MREAVGLLLVLGLVLVCVVLLIRGAPDDEKRLGVAARAGCPACRRGSVLLVWPEEVKPAVEWVFAQGWRLNPDGMCPEHYDQATRIAALEDDTLGDGQG